MERDVWNTRAGEMHGTQTAQIRANERLTVRLSSHCQQKEQLRLLLLSTVTMGKGWPSRLSGAT